MCDCFCMVFVYVSLTAVNLCLFVNILKEITILMDLMYSLLNTILYIQAETLFCTVVRACT